MSVPYTDFLSEVIPYVNDCPEFVAVNAVRNACIEFCEKSLYLLHTPASQDLVSGTSVYALSLPAGTTIAQVLDVWGDSRLIKPVGEDQLKRIFPFDWSIQEGAPQYYTHVTPTNLTLVPIPNYNVAAGLHMTLAVKPTRASTTVDDSILEKWAEVIAYGARARLHAIPNQPFTEPTVAVTYRAMFLSGVNQARVERTRGLARSTMVVRPPRFV